MRFLIISSVLHKASEGLVGGYAPYVREMNLWLRHVEEVQVIAPIELGDFSAIDLAYEHPRLKFVPVPEFNITSPRNVIKTLMALSGILIVIFRGMRWAEHIHLRCPSNMGLLGSLVQILFPWKPKTTKYAGNWDWASRQPWSYRMQQRILRNLALTQNMQVLVYGEWSDRNRNIKPFFTASYREDEVVPWQPKVFDDRIRLVFVGALSPGKRPMFCIEVARALLEQGIPITLDLYGEGVERASLERVIEEDGLNERIRLHGNVAAEIVKESLQQSHFLLFASKSEGWPKVVAESMFWGCVPITTAVSCVPYMLGDGRRGAVIAPDLDSACIAITRYVNDPGFYNEHSRSGAEWSRQFTLEEFERKIVSLLRKMHGG